MLPRVLRRFLPDDLLPDAALLERLETELHRSPAAGTKIRIPLAGSPFFLQIHHHTLSVEWDLPVPASPELDWDLEKQPEITWGDFTFKCRFSKFSKKQMLKDGNAHFDSDRLPHTLKITSWHEGDTLQSFDGHRKNLKRLFCDQHVSGEDRLKIPVLRTPDGEVLFVPGVRTAKCSEIIGATVRTVTISWSRKRT